MWREGQGRGGSKGAEGGQSEAESQQCGKEDRGGMTVEDGLQARTTEERAVPACQWS